MSRWFWAASETVCAWGVEPAVGRWGEGIGRSAVLRFGAGSRSMGGDGSVDGGEEGNADTR